MTRSSPALIMAALVLFLVLGGAGIAANGDSLILGKTTNSATLKTALSASINDRSFQLTNTNTGGGATALGLTVASGHPPLFVNSNAGKATNLNVDKLDGFDSAGFWKLGGNGVGSPGLLGTTTNQPLELKVNGQRALQLAPNASSPNLIGGYSGNAAQVGAFGATISGGGVSGYANRVSDDLSTVGGGQGNLAGDDDTALTNAVGSTVAGGYFNTASGAYSAAGGGYSNTASGYISAIGGGYLNTASGYISAVGGGYSNTASGDYGFAAGVRAVADDDRSFVWSDGNWSGGNVYSPAAGSFSAHATGGFNFWTNQYAPTTGCWIAPGGGSISCSSSRRVKKDFAPVDRERLLQRLARVPVSTWSYKNEKSGIRHIGPMAQDFARAFKVGEDETSIAMVDADGVAFAAIQGLYRQNQALERQNAALRRRMRVQGARLSRLERRVDALSRAHHSPNERGER